MMDAEIPWASRPVRLLEAACFIESVPDAQFNMDHWWLPDGIAFDDDRNVMYKVADGPCGCAVGNLVQQDLWGLYKLLVDAKDGKFKTVDREIVFAVVARVFGIPLLVTQFMFDQDAYTGIAEKTQVVRRMRLIAKEYGFTDD